VSGAAASRPVANKNILRIRHRRTRKANKQEEEGGRKTRTRWQGVGVGDSPPDTKIYGRKKYIKREI